MAARKTSALPTRIWRFPARLTSPSEDVREILWRSNRYYNRLVEIERSRSARFSAIRRAHAPELAALEDRWVAIDDAIASLYREAKAGRQDHWRDTGGERTRLLPAEYEARKAALVAEQKAVSTAAKPLRVAFGALLEAARAAHKERKGVHPPRTQSKVNGRVLEEMLSEEAWHPVWKSIARSDDLAHRESLAARESNGLHGGTYLAVEEAFRRAKTDCSPGPPRFRSLPRHGKIQVQIRDRTWAGMAEATGVQVVRLPSRSTSARSNIFAITLDQSRGDEERVVSFTARVHRLPPDDAQVKWVALMVHRDSRDRLTCELQLTLEHASFAEPKRPSGSRSPEHIQIGWSRVRGGIRVAQWPGGEVVCPDLAIDGVSYADSIISAADRFRDEAVRRLRAVTRASGHRISHLAWERMGRRNVGQLRAWCDLYARFVLGDEVEARWRAWIHYRRSRGEDLYAPMRVLRATMPARDAFAWWCWLWARKHAHLQDLASHVRRKAEHRRDAHYRSEAIRIATEFASCTVDSYSIASLAEREPLTMPGEGVRDIPQWHRQVSAPGRFREILLEVMGTRCEKRERSGGAKRSGTAVYSYG